VHVPPARPYLDLERFLPADQLRNLLQDSHTLTIQQ
jgi:hypothetical protein